MSKKDTRSIYKNRNPVKAWNLISNIEFWIKVAIFHIFYGITCKNLYNQSSNIFNVFEYESGISKHSQWDDNIV